MVENAPCGGCKDPAAGLEVDVVDADVGHAALRLEGDVPGVAEDDHAAQSVGGPCEAPLAPVAADAVFDEEVAPLDAELDAVAIGDENAWVGRFPAEGVG
jgi:hypothetical protein